MIPLIFAGDLWAPLAYAVMFGLVFSVFITLVLIPIIYYRKPGEIDTLAGATDVADTIITDADRR